MKSRSIGALAFIVRGAGQYVEKVKPKNQA